MKNITENFYWYEAACADGTEVPEGLRGNVMELAINLQVLRDALKYPIHINSWYRSEEYNASLPGSSPDSQHLLGKAADIRSDEYTPEQLSAVIEALINLGLMKQGGIGIYKSFIHYDMRGIKKRWNER
jgi:uncharacterized protein YcbK (DUF882 family)